MAVGERREAIAVERGLLPLGVAHCGVRHSDGGC